MRLEDRIEVRQNLRITMRERGKIVERREGHNIWLDFGREYLAGLLALSTVSPDTPERTDRPKYIGFGIGGNRQLSLSTANSLPISPPYLGTNLYVDTDSSVKHLERPVRISGSDAPYPGVTGDVWVGTIQPTQHPVSTEALLRRVFSAAEISYLEFASVPLSEIALFTAAADPGNFQNRAIAYDTFDTLHKTQAVALEVDWGLQL